jgi:hypothetical protein
MRSALKNCSAPPHNFGFRAARSGEPVSAVRVSRFIFYFWFFEIAPQFYF